MRVTKSLHGKLSGNAADRRLRNAGRHLEGRGCHTLMHAFHHRMPELFGNPRLRSNKIRVHVVACPGRAGIIIAVARKPDVVFVRGRACFAGYRSLGNLTRGSGPGLDDVFHRRCQKPGRRLLEHLPLLPAL